MKKTVCVMSVLLVFSFTAFSQTDTSDNISWKGAILNVSTPSDIIERFGPAKKDDTNRLPLITINKLNIFDLRVDKKEWRILRYKNIEHVSDVIFGFNRENVLIFISFKPPLKDEQKRVHVQSFLKAFKGIEFKQRESAGYSFTVHGNNQSGYVLAEVHRIITPTDFVKKNVEDVAIEDLDGLISKVQYLSITLERPENTDILR